MTAVFRTGLLVLAAPQVVVGVWGLLAPQAFYDGFPAPGHAWVALLPPYNEHLTRDVGALNLALAVLLVAAAVAPERRLVRVALLVQLVWTVPHAVFHLGHLDGFPPVDAVVQSVGLVGSVLLPVALLALSGRLSAASPPPHGPRRAARPPSRSPSSPSA